MRISTLFSPQRLLAAIRRRIKPVPPTELEILYAQDCRLMQQHMGCLHGDYLEAMKADMILHAHVLEKGMTMPDFRPGFGKEKIDRLCKLMQTYHSKGYDMNDFSIRFAAEALREYINKHTQLSYPFSEQELSSLNAAANLAGEKSTQQIHTTADAFFSANHADFAQFSASRHSVRQFSGPADITNIQKAIELAQNAPSACNRQYMKVYLLSGKEKVNAILSLQGGNSALMNAADQVLILTADMRSLMWTGERRDLWHNAGIYCMNLSYALHYNRIGHCLCAWSVPPEVDAQLHELAEIPQNEAITVLILIGQVAQSFTVTSSPRKNWQDVLVIR